MSAVSEGGRYLYCQKISEWFKFIPSTARDSLWPDGQPEGIPDIQTVLVIDDDHQSGWLKAYRLSRFGLDTCLVHGAEAATHAIEFTQRFPHGDSPDLVLMDFNMTEKHGIDVSRQLRERWPRCSIVCVTATSLADEGVESPVNELLRLQAKQLGIPIRSVLDFARDLRGTLQHLITESARMVSEFKTES